MPSSSGRTNRLRVLDTRTDHAFASLPACPGFQTEPFPVRTQGTVRLRPLPPPAHLHTHLCPSHLFRKALRVIHGRRATNELASVPGHLFLERRIDFRGLILRFQLPAGHGDRRREPTLERTGKQVFRATTTYFQMTGCLRTKDTPLLSSHLGVLGLRSASAALPTPTPPTPLLFRKTTGLTQINTGHATQTASQETLRTRNTEPGPSHPGREKRPSAVSHSPRNIYTRQDP